MDEINTALEKTRRKINTLNRVRVFFLFIAVVIVLFIFWGGKAWEETVWFPEFRQKCYNFLWYDIVLLVIVTFWKLFAVMRYNSKVKKM